MLCCNFSTWCDKVNLPRVYGGGVVELLTPPLKLVSDRYTIYIVVRHRGFGQIICAQIGGAFHLRHDVLNANGFGVYHEPGEWMITPAEHGSNQMSLPTDVDVVPPDSGMCDN
jgi:lipopolysaccharide transport system ATP-binding protein